MTCDSIKLTKLKDETSPEDIEPRGFFRGRNDNNANET
nr:MAG TPA: hypothetical protein [Caudoviricetes sp.]